jgi:hypothetical protein
MAEAADELALPGDAHALVAPVQRLSNAADLSRSAFGGPRGGTYDELARQGTGAGTSSFPRLREDRRNSFGVSKTAIQLGRHFHHRALDSNQVVGGDAHCLH